MTPWKEQCVALTLHLQCRPLISPANSAKPQSSIGAAGAAEAPSVIAVLIPHILPIWRNDASNPALTGELHGKTA
jgi:hypothetical protein